MQLLLVGLSGLSEDEIRNALDVQLDDEVTGLGTATQINRRQLESVIDARKGKGHGEALPASPWPYLRWNDGTDRSTLPIHGTPSIGQSVSRS